MAEGTDNSEVNIKILKALDTAISEGPWSESPFLKATGKKLQAIRGEFAKGIGMEGSLDVGAGTGATETAVPKGMIEVYMLLYVAEGSKLHKWEGILSSVEKYSLSRPIYRSEQDIQNILREKGDDANNGYIAVLISETDITEESSEEVPKDRHGNELLVVRDRSVKPEHITRFVHVGSEFQFKDSKLIPK